MEINVIGGGWVTAVNFGRMTDRTGPVLAAGNPVVPPAASIYTQPPVRYRRFDDYARVGCAAIALALKDAGLDHGADPAPIGIIAATRWGCFDTDRAYYATAKEDRGAFASPNLFSFTLPGIVLGEAAIHFRLTGPTFTIGDEIGQRGLAALDVAADLLASGICRTILAGWLEVDERRAVGNFAANDEPQGGVFVVLSTQHAENAIRRISRRDFMFYTEAEKVVETIADLFD
ncbi:MAG: beta-ketoacyl synthase N-terminal-like domain-containing protein [Desulfobacterales bacterium]